MFGISTLKLVILAVAVAGVVGFFWHYQSLKSERDTLLGEVGKMEVINEVNKEHLRQTTERMAEIVVAVEESRARLNDLIEEQKEASAEVRRIKDVFSKHNLSNLLDKKTTLVLRRINDGIANSSRMLECETRGGVC